ncbi:MAG TPA: hypothetical protein VJP76_01375 [Candidatus Tumulicola sp.]|nr:hypothetical protein [Candidatus Tumulicola sp.]
MKSAINAGAVTGAALAVLALAAGGTRFAAPTAAATPPPTPPPLSTPASPAPEPAATPQAVSTTITFPTGYGFPAPQPQGSGKPAATPSPPPDARKGIDGVWEVEIQQGSKTDYAHFKLAQAGTTLTGTYLNDAGKRFPLAGSVDGETVRMVVSMPDGTTLVLEGRLDGTSDMIGMLTSAQGATPFTAAYRPKEKWIDNLNASPGGLGGMGGGAPP